MKATTEIGSQLLRIIEGACEEDPMYATLVSEELAKIRRPPRRADARGHGQHTWEVY